VSAHDVYEERGFGGRQGAGTKPAVVVVDFIEGFTNPESRLACDADADLAALIQQTLMETVDRYEERCA